MKANFIYDFRSIVRRSVCYFCTVKSCVIAFIGKKRSKIKNRIDKIFDTSYLINNEGNLIGINTKIYSKTGAYQGLGFAIPSEKVTQIAAEIIKFGEVRKAWIGNFRVTSSRVVMGDQRLPSLKIVEIEPNKGIYLEGLRTNDQIIKVNSLPASWNNLTDAINYALPGDSISIDFVNSEGLQKITIEVTSYKK